MTEVGDPVWAFGRIVGTIVGVNKDGTAIVEMNEDDVVKHLGWVGFEDWDLID